jgi:poly [ADP-ribose] polymerase 2/3/4
MPQVKEESPPPSKALSLDGVTISFASYTPGIRPELDHKRISRLKTEIASCGGTYTPAVNQCTHLIATQAQYDKGNERVLEVRNKAGVSVVLYAWLAQSLESDSPIDIDHYLLNKPAAKDADLDKDEQNDQNDQTPSPATKTLPKRPRKSEDDGENEAGRTKKPKTTNSSEAPPKIKSVNIPVDNEVPHPESYTVYVDDNGVIWDATLNKSDSTENNNKFYRVQVLQDGSSFKTWTRWGRVGERGQKKMLGDGSLSSAQYYFMNKFKDKSGLSWEEREQAPKRNKYSYLEVDYEDSDDEQATDEPTPRDEGDDEDPSEKQVFAPSKLPKPVQQLMELIFNMSLFNATMAELNYDANKMPLGKLSKKTLLKGYEVLKELASLVADPTLAANLYAETHNEAVESRSNRYFSLVPHVVGRKALPVLNNLDLIRVSTSPLSYHTDWH